MDDRKMSSLDVLAEAALYYSNNQENSSASINCPMMPKKRIQYRYQAEQDAELEAARILVAHRSSGYSSSSPNTNESLNPSSPNTNEFLNHSSPNTDESPNHSSPNTDESPNHSLPNTDESPNHSSSSEVPLSYHSSSSSPISDDSSRPTKVTNRSVKGSKSVSNKKRSRAKNNSTTSNESTVSNLSTRKRTESKEEINFKKFAESVSITPKIESSSSKINWTDEVFDENCKIEVKTPKLTYTLRGMRKRKASTKTPDDQRDQEYYEKRHRNNEAARKSRNNKNLAIQTSAFKLKQLEREREELELEFGREMMMMQFIQQKMASDDNLKQRVMAMAKEKDLVQFMKVLSLNQSK